MAKGIIGINGLKIMCVIGCLPEERIKEQEITLDVKVRAPFTSIEERICYVKISEVCTKLAQEKKHLLLESLAVDMMETLMATFPISWAWVGIKKPSAIPSAEFAFVELESSMEGK